MHIRQQESVLPSTSTNYSFGVDKIQFVAEHRRHVFSVNTHIYAQERKAVLLLHCYLKPSRGVLAQRRNVYFECYVMHLQHRKTRCTCEAVQGLLV